MPPKVSIIITTRNRAEHLRATLESFRDLTTPKELPVELLVVDNASTDDTIAVIKAFHLRQMSVRYLHEPKPGQSNARNSGMASATGEVILFTDDDVRVPADWVQRMFAPIFRGEADAVTGSIRLAPDLERSWMTGCHKGWLAISNPDWLPSVRTTTGANMGFSRAVLQRVPAFDPELGPGAIGFSDDTLFSLQIIEAGLGIQYLADVEVEHHPQKDRLLRKHWLATARRRGATKAYVSNHWFHEEHRRIYVNRIRALFELWAWRKQNILPAPDEEGCAESELWLVRSCGFWTALLRESRRPRNYAKKGLIKLLGVMPERSVEPIYGSENVAAVK